MRKSLSVAVAALTLVTSTTASAGDRYGRHHHHDHYQGGEVAAVAAVAGLVGLAIGAAVASSNREKAARAERVAMTYDTNPTPTPEPQPQPRRENVPWYGPYSEGPGQGCFVERYIYDPQAGRDVRERKAVWCDEPATNGATAN